MNPNFFVDIISPIHYSRQKYRSSRSLVRRTGNTVEIGGEPVAVIGDEDHNMSLFHNMEWEGVASRRIRKPENLTR